jgi:hypothetical protein
MIASDSIPTGYKKEIATKRRDVKEAMEYPSKIQSEKLVFLKKAPSNDDE